jgi:hypothetical protein
MEEKLGLALVLDGIASLTTKEEFESVMVAVKDRKTEVGMRNTLGEY